MMKESVHQEDTTILNIYAPETAAKYVKLKLIEMKEEIDKSIIIVANFNTPFS